MASSSRPARTLPLALFASALAVRLLVIALARFDGLYGQDAYAYYDYARQLITTPFGTPLPGLVYWPLGYSALASVFMRFTGLAPLGAQLASVVTGAALAPLVYLVTLEILESLPPSQARPHSHTAFAAGLITTLSGQLLQSSIVVMADIPALFWGTLSAYAWLRFDRTRQPFWLPFAAAALALAIVTRWIFAGLILPFGLFACLTLYHPVALSPRHRVSLAIALILFSLVLLPQFYFSQTSAAPVLSHSWLLSWNPLNAFRTSFDNPDGHFDYRLPPILFYAEPFFHPFYLFPLLTPFILVGAWRLRRARALILLGGWALGVYFYLIGIPYENFRFGLACFPPIVLLAALGLDSIKLPFTLSARSIPVEPRHRAASLWGLVTLSLLASLPFTHRGLSAFLAIKSRELAAAHYLQSQIPPRATVLTFGLTLTLDHYTDLSAVDLSVQSPETLRVFACSAPPAYLFVETENLAAQWAGKTPEVNFHWLRDRARLTEAGRFDTWTLYGLQSNLCRTGTREFVIFV